MIIILISFLNLSLRGVSHAEGIISHRGTEGTEGAAPGRKEGNGGNGERPTVADSPNSENLLDSENILLNLQMPPRLCVRKSLCSLCSSV